MPTRPLFGAATVFNAVIGLALIFEPAAFFAGLGMAEPQSFLVTRFLGWCILVFAIGYALVFLRPEANRDIVRMSIIGKLGVFVLVAAHFLSGQAPWLALVLVGGDLLFAAAFAVWLNQANRAV